MLAGGVGITLALALIRRLAVLALAGEQVPNVSLLVSVAHFRDLAFLTELLTLEATHAWLTVLTHVTRDSVRDEVRSFKAGRIDEDAIRNRASEAEAVIICGDASFVKSMASAVHNVFPHSRLLVEAFSAATVPEPAFARTGRPTVSLTVANEGRIVEGRRSDTLLVSLEKSGVKIRSRCRSGICDSCRIRVVTGACESEDDIALSASERAAEYALAVVQFRLTPQSK
ncbi:MAG: hypothetical protein CBARDCOR_6717 [uncultured Caballeronia sp.]|nr:MAG: hypothetical protein CBARDCOR_6717 [uncultured Caballeronia sp.]